MSKVYPSQRYHPDHGTRTVVSADDDAKLEGWFESPADYGVETCPGVTPDPVIAAKREVYLRSKGQDAPETAQRKPRRAKA